MGRPSGAGFSRCALVARCGDDCRFLPTGGVISWDCMLCGLGLIRRKTELDAEAPGEHDDGPGDRRYGLARFRLMATRVQRDDN